MKNLFISIKGLQLFCKVCIETVKNFAPKKRKYTRANQIPFMTKEHSKEIITRSRLKNNFLKKLSEENKIRYAKCVSFLRSTKKKYYGNLDKKKL